MSPKRTKSVLWRGAIKTKHLCGSAAAHFLRIVAMMTVTLASAARNLAAAAAVGFGRTGRQHPSC
ncbi:hypothetical protein NXC24_PC01165 (plasmid) [Rhizobium sp. NXC24]|nr:hypothetical protein NXC24_PC01165 [Rhizobium sp. NXC24]